MKNRVVNRLFAVLLSAVMVFSDVTPAFAADKTVSVNEAEEFETETEDVAVEAEEESDYSVSEDVVSEKSEDMVSENEGAVSEETEDASDESENSVSEDSVSEDVVSESSTDEAAEDEELEVIAEENWDGATYADTPSGWHMYISLPKASSSNDDRDVSNVYVRLYSTDSITSYSSATPSSRTWKMIVYGEKNKSVDLTETIWTTIAAKEAWFNKAGYNDGTPSFPNKTGYTFADYLPYIGELRIQNMAGFSAASTLIPKLTSCTNIVFETSSSLGSATVAAFSGTPFKGHTKLQSVQLPASITSLSTGYFNGCTALTSVTGSNFTSIPDSCFYNCTSLTAVPNASSITSVGADSFRGCTKLASVPSSVTTVGANAFYGCTGITSASLGACSSIGSQAFRGSNISSLTLKSGCSIGDYAFYGTKVASIDVSNVSLGTGVFQQCGSLKTVTCNTFDAGQFTGCPLTTLNIKASGTLTSSLKNMSSLTTVNAPNITGIGNEVFYNCSSLSNVTFGALTSVGASAFYNCPISEDKINIAKLTSIGTDAFKQTRISKVVLNSSITSFPNAFGNCYLTSVTMPGVSVIPSFTSFASSLTEIIAANATSISDGAFSNCKKLSTINIPKVTAVGESAFSGCTNITQSNVPLSNFSSIGLNAFADTGITQITLSSKISEFPNAFSGCAIESITMPGVESIGSGKFTSFKNTLKNVDGEKVTALNENAFAGCAALKTVEFPKLKTIGSSAFSDCTSLTSAHHENVETIGNLAYQGCTGLTSITFENAKTIGTSAFDGCSKLTTLALDKVSTIEENAFRNCPIKALALDNILTIGKGAFSGCSSLKSASIETATTVYRDAFSGCENLDALSLRDITLIEANAFYGIGNALSSKPVISIPADKNVSIQNGAFVGNVGYVTYDDTEDVWNEKVSLGGTQKEVFGDAYILFKDGKKLYPDTPTGGTDNPDGPTEPPTPETPSGTPTNPTTPTDPSTPSDGKLTDEEMEKLIEEIVKLIVVPDASDTDAVKTWLDGIQKIAEKYGFDDIEKLVQSALENIDNPEILKGYLEQIIDALKDKVADTPDTLIETAPDSTDGMELVDWWFHRIKDLAKENNWTDLYNLALEALDNIDDETKRADYITKLLALLKEKQSESTVTPTPTPAPTEPTDGEIADPNAKYYTAVFYTYYGGAPQVYVEKNIVEGGSVLNIPKAEYEGFTFMGWYDVDSLIKSSGTRWYPGTPIYKDIVLSAIFMNTKGEVVVVIPDTEIPTNGSIDADNPPVATVTTPGNRNISINFNVIPSTGGLGDLNASGLDGFIPFYSITKDNTQVYMVKGQKVIDTSVNMVSSDAKILKVSKDGSTVTAKKDGVAYLSITNKLSGKTYKARVNVVTPKMSSKKLTVKSGQTCNAIITCGSYTNKYPIYWASSNVDVAYVEASSTHGVGIIHGIGKGSAIITAYINGKAYKCSVKVKDTIDITSVAGTIQLIPQETVNIAKSGINGMDGFDAKNATWTYDKENVVTVDDNGILKAVGLGTATVSGVAKDGARKKFTVTVSSVVPHTVHINIGQSKKVTLYKISAKKAIWKSSNPEIATVNENGKISAHQTGTALITANYMGFIYKYYVYVENPSLVNTENLSGSDKKYSLAIDNSKLTQLSVVYANQPVVFISKKPEIAFVDENGFVRGRSTGVTDITTKINKMSIKIKASVF